MDDVRRARGLIQGAYSKLLGRFGSESDALESLVEALGLLKGLTDEDIKPKVAPPASNITKVAATPSTTTRAAPRRRSN